MAGLGVWFPIPFALRLDAAALLAFFLTGWLLLQALGLTVDHWMEQAVPALGVSYGLTVLGSLIAGVLGVIALVLAMV